MRKPVILSGLLVAGLALTACSNGPEEGLVTGRSYTPQSTFFVSSCSGNPPVCTMIPMTSGPTWELHLVHGEEKGWRSVNPDAYYKCEKNERYPECAA